MKRIFALVLVTALLAAVVIPQVMAVSWKTYNDPQGRFEMKYPADWYFADEGVIGFDISMGSKDGDLNCLVLVTLEKSRVDETGTDGGYTTRTVNIPGKKYAVSLVFSASAGNFDSANKTYFEPMIKSVKAK